MDKKLTLLYCSLLIVICSILYFWIFVDPRVALGILLASVLVYSVMIFTAKGATALRFMYPALITFLFFLVLPILFTIYIAFTNLSTKHFLSKNEVLEILKTENYIDPSAKIYTYFLVEKEESREFEVMVFDSEDDSSKDHYRGKFPISLKDGKISLYKASRSQTLPEPDKRLKRGQIFRLRDQLDSLTFILPDNTALKYYRTQNLAPLKKRYAYLGDDQLKSLETGIVYAPDYEKGFFTANDGTTTGPGFHITIQFGNFKKLFQDDSIKKAFIKIFSWTLTWAFMSVFLCFSFGMFLALLVNRRDMKLKMVYRMLLIVPYSVPFFIAVLVFKGLLNKDFGVINELLASIGIVKIPWLNEPTFAKISCLMVNLWLGFPYMFLVSTGVLQSIPQSIYEAAALDGAGKWATFKSITLPMIFSAIGPLLVGTFAFNLNNFVGIYLLTGGGPAIPGATTPAGETDILISYTYRLAFEGGRGQDFGLAASISILIFLMVAVLTVIKFRVTGMMDDKTAKG